MTLFPEMVEQGMQTSIMGRAMKKGLLSLQAVNIRDYTEDKHHKVDDYPYGGGAGMLMQAQPVFRCYEEIIRRVKEGVSDGRDGAEAEPARPRVVYLTPQGERFCQPMARELAKEEHLVFLCGHYEGIDERVLEEIVTDYISIGDYVLTGGELAAMVVMDAVARLAPGVLHNEESADFETFHNDLLEYPQYSRPEVWHGKPVPPVLLSGDHRRVQAWRVEQSKSRTQARRPDLYHRYCQKQFFIQFMIKKGKIQHMDMIESLRRGRGEIVQATEDGVVVRDGEAKVYMLAAFQESKAGEIIQWLGEVEDGWQYVLHQECLLGPLEQRLLSSGKLPYPGFLARKCIMPVYLTVYTQGNARHIRKDLEFQSLGMEFLEEVLGHYHLAGGTYIEERLRSGNLYGAFADGCLAGFAGIHQEGSLGMLEVYKNYRRQGIGQALEAYLINLHLSMGYTPYGMVGVENHASLEMQKKMGLCISRGQAYWVTLGESHNA